MVNYNSFINKSTIKKKIKEKCAEGENIVFVSRYQKLFLGITFLRFNFEVNNRRVKRNVSFYVCDN